MNVKENKYQYQSTDDNLNSLKRSTAPGTTSDSFTVIPDQGVCLLVKFVLLSVTLLSIPQSNLERDTTCIEGSNERRNERRKERETHRACITSVAIDLTFTLCLKYLVITDFTVVAWF